MGKLGATAEKVKGEYHQKMAEHGPNSSKGEHAAEATKAKANEKKEEYI